MSQAKPLGEFRAIVATDAIEAFLDVQRALVSEAKWHLDPEGIRACAVDPANVAMFDARIDAAGFESYEATDGTVGLNLDRLHEYVTSKVAGDLVDLRLDPETRKLVVDVGPTEYTMALIDPESIRKEPDVPDLSDDLTATIGIDGPTLQNAIDAAELVSDHVGMGVEPDDRVFFIRAKGDTDTADTELSDDELLSADTGPRAVRSLFSLDYLVEIVEPVGSDSVVRLKLGEEFPVVMDYALADDHVEVRSQLAPRIDSTY